MLIECMNQEIKSIRLSHCFCFAATKSWGEGHRMRQLEEHTSDRLLSENMLCNCVYYSTSISEAIVCLTE